MNLFKDEILPVSLFTSLILVGDDISTKALIWAELASIPLWVTIYYKKFSEDTPKVHFEGLSII